MRRRRHPGLAVVAAVALGGILAWATTTDDVRVWPARNTLVYRAVTAWWGVMGTPRYGAAGTVTGVVRDPSGKPIAGARVLLTAAIQVANRSQARECC